MDLNAAREYVTAFVTDSTNPPPPRRPRWLRRGNTDLVEVADAIIALICFLTQYAWLMQQHVPVAPLFAFVTSAPLALRTRLPFTAWAASAMAIVGTSLFFPMATREAAPAIVYGLCLYAVTVRCVPRIIVAAAIVTAAAGFVITPRGAAVVIILAAIPLLLGAVVRTRRSGTRRLAEQERKHSGERALLEERQRIARELHDVVAHHMSVIAIQAEAAPYKSANPPPELVESFGDIRQSALTGLTELRRLLGVLRTGTPDTAPQPGLGDLEILLDSARSGDVSVTADITGEPVPLPDGVDLSAYRILQEALSNAMRHSPGSHVDVRIAYRTDNLELDIRNDTGTSHTGEDAARADHAGLDHADPDHAGPDPLNGGHGIIGMRERASMLGGTLFAGPVQGGFRVHSVLPLNREPSQEGPGADPDHASAPDHDEDPAASRRAS
jgi:signal transduction histidine kinase